MQDSAGRPLNLLQELCRLCLETPGNYREATLKLPQVRGWLQQMEDKYSIMSSDRICRDLENRWKECGMDFQRINTETKTGGILSAPFRHGKSVESKTNCRREISGPECTG